MADNMLVFLSELYLTLSFSLFLEMSLVPLQSLGVPLEVHVPPFEKLCYEL